MTIEEYSLILGEELTARFPDMSGNWMFDFSNCELKGDGVLIGVCGHGESFGDARSEYIREIKGKTIVFNAMRENRREFTVPTTLE